MENSMSFNISFSGTSECLHLRASQISEEEIKAFKSSELYRRPLETLSLLGTVKGLYRYWGYPNELFESCNELIIICRQIQHTKYKRDSHEDIRYILANLEKYNLEKILHPALIVISSIGIALSLYQLSNNAVEAKKYFEQRLIHVKTQKQNLKMLCSYVDAIQKKYERRKILPQKGKELEGKPVDYAMADLLINTIVSFWELIDKEQEIIYNEKENLKQSIQVSLLFLREVANCDN